MMSKRFIQAFEYNSPLNNKQWTVIYCYYHQAIIMGLSKSFGF